MENDRSELMKDWAACQSILCIRADNMGDLLMSTPAIAALKNTLDCKITLLTSSKAADVARLVPEIDRIIVADLQWVKLGNDPGPEMLMQLISFLKEQQFDGCVIFNVYSQHTMPAAMVAYLSGIPLRLAYCRENPYHLLSHWVPDPEPYSYIIHQTERDLDLVRMIGAVTKDKRLRLKLSKESLLSARLKAERQGLDLKNPYLILHPGVSEDKRMYPEENWIKAGRMLVSELGVRLLITGSAEERTMAERIAAGIGVLAFPAAGLFSLEEFAMVINHAQLLISVNTGTIHLAAALDKPLVVLYAQTNPQHTPWMVRCRILEYSIPEQSMSKNQVIRYVNEQYYSSKIPYPSPDEVLLAVRELLNAKE